MFVLNLTLCFTTNRKVSPAQCTQICFWRLLNRFFYSSSSSINSPLRHVIAPLHDQTNSRHIVNVKAGKNNIIKYYNASVVINTM